MNFKRYIWILERKIELELRTNDNLKGVSIGEKFHMNSMWNL